MKPKLIKAKKPSLVEVHWIDAVDRDFSGPIPEAIVRGKLSERYQGGYLIHQDETVTVLAQTYDPPEPDVGIDVARVDYLTVIPTKWVISIKGRRKEKPRAVAVPDRVETKDTPPQKV